MVDDAALGVDAAEANTWILALLVDACQGLSALGIRDTLRAALCGRVSMVASQTGACRYAVALSALGVLATRRWLAGVRVLRLIRRRHRLWLWSAVGEWISGVSLRTVAHDDVVHHVTFCSRAALAGTRVLALVVVTVLVSRTVKVHDTFRLACNVWISEIFSSAYANANAILI